MPGVDTAFARKSYATTNDPHRMHEMGGNRVNKERGRMKRIARMQYGIGWLIAALATSCVQPVLSQQDTSTGTGISIPRTFAHHPTPKWENGFLVGFETEPQHSPLVYAYDRGGQRLFEVPLAIDGASRVLVRSMAASRDGRFAFSGGAQSASGASVFFIAFLDRAGQITRVNRLSGLRARHLCFAPDGTLWAAVHAGQRVPGSGVEPEHDILRVYTPQGELKFSLLPRSGFGPVTGDWIRHPHPAEEYEFLPTQLAANDSETVFISPGFKQLVRVSRDGRVLSRTTVDRPALDAPVTGFALAPNGEIHISTQEKSGSDTKQSDFVFYRWNTVAGQWIRIYSRSSRERGRPIALEMFEQDRMLVRTGDARYQWVGQTGGNYRLADE